MQLTLFIKICIEPINLDLTIFYLTRCSSVLSELHYVLKLGGGNIPQEGSKHEGNFCNLLMNQLGGMGVLLNSTEEGCNSGPWLRTLKRLNVKLQLYIETGGGASSDLRKKMAPEPADVGCGMAMKMHTILPAHIQGQFHCPS